MQWRKRNEKKESRAGREMSVSFNSRLSVPTHEWVSCNSVDEGEISGGGEDVLPSTKEIVVDVTEGRESKEQEHEQEIER